MSPKVKVGVALLYPTEQVHHMSRSILQPTLFNGHKFVHNIYKRYFLVKTWIIILYTLLTLNAGENHYSA